MLDNALKMESYYYSTNYDLTHSFQRLYNTSPDFHSMSLLERVNKAHLLIYMYFIFYKYLSLILNGFIHFGHSLSVHSKHIIFGCKFFWGGRVESRFLFSLFLKVCNLQNYGFHLIYIHKANVQSKGKFLKLSRIHVLLLYAIFYFSSLLGLQCWT